jgi:hypothetical protein
MITLRPFRKTDFPVNRQAGKKGRQRPFLFSLSGTPARIFLTGTIAIPVSAPTKNDMLNERPSEDSL